MKLVIRVCMVVALGAASLLAQDDVLFFQQAAPAPPPPPPPPPPGVATFSWEAGTPASFVASRFASAGAIKAAPYSAESVVENTQTLADGNRIVNKQSTKVYRDSEGRERREMTIGTDRHEIFISDPVAGVNYTLNPDDKTAVKMPGAQFFVHTVDGKDVVGMGTAGGAVKGVTSFTVATPAPAGAAVRTRNEVTIVRNSFEEKVIGGELLDSVTDDLGTRNMEGVVASGTRTKHTIPAGQIGNERPIEMVTETWFSPELKLTVYSKTTDPRMGENVMKLTNINRAEPSRLLFEVPPDYKLIDRAAMETEKLIMRKMQGAKPE